MPAEALTYGGEAITYGGEAITYNVEGVSVILRPVSDISSGPWLPSQGSSLYAVLDETQASDTDYVYTTAAGSFEVALQTISMSPGTCTVRYRLRSLPSANFFVTLLKNTTEIVTWYHLAAPTSYQLVSQTLTTPQKEAITDGTNLRIRVTVDTESYFLNEDGSLRMLEAGDGFRILE